MEALPHFCCRGQKSKFPSLSTNLLGVVGSRFFKLKRRFCANCFVFFVKEKERIFKILADRPDLEIWPSSANHLYLRPKIAEGEDRSGKLQQLTTALKELGTLIRYTGGGLRITIGTHQENNRTLERLQKLLDR